MAQSEPLAICKASYGVSVGRGAFGRGSASRQPSSISERLCAWKDGYAIAVPCFGGGATTCNPDATCAEIGTISSGSRKQKALA
jgi:hypothetical protein